LAAVDAPDEGSPGKALADLLMCTVFDERAALWLRNKWATGG